MAMIKCPNCGFEADDSQTYCMNCGSLLKNEEIKKTPNNNNLKRSLVLVGIISAVLVAAICLVLTLTSSKHYRCVSDGVYAYGESLNGPSPDLYQISLDLNTNRLKNNTKIEYHYYGKVYTGRYYDGYLLWDNEPIILSGGSEAYTLISKNGKNISMSIYMSYPIDGQMYYVEIRQGFIKD